MRKLKIKERIHAEGAMVILFTAVLAVVLIAVLNIFFPHQTFWHFLAYFLIFAYNFWTVCFFRIPIYRKTTLLENAVLSPADGKVVAVVLVVVVGCVPALPPPLPVTDSSVAEVGHQTVMET